MPAHNNRFQGRSCIKCQGTNDSEPPLNRDEAVCLRDGSVCCSYSDTFNEAACRRCTRPT